MPAKKTTPSLKETLLGLFLLGVLAIIAVGVYFEQNRFYPILQDRVEEMMGKQAPVPPTSEAVESLFSHIALPQGMASLSEPETFDASTLSDKIDGKAELYLSSGFLRLETLRFRARGETDAWVEAFVYQMNDPQGAFAVFSQQKRDDTIPAEAGRISYQTQNALFGIHGPYYFEIIASSETPVLQEALQALGQALVTALPMTKKPVLEKSLFPPEGLDPRSIVLIAADAFGFEKLNKVFTAVYTIDGVQLTAFVSPRADPGEAQNLATAYREFLAQFEAEPLKTDSPIKEEIHAFSIMGSVEMFFSVGSYLAGVHQAEDEEKALALSKKIRDYLIKIDETH